MVSRSEARALVASNEYEREACELRKAYSYGHVKIIDPILLIGTGLGDDIEHAFRQVG